MAAAQVAGGRAVAGVSEEEFDRAPRRRPTRPVARGVCTVCDCQGELHCRGLCFRHERAWRKAGAGPLAQFIAAARPLIRTEPCLVVGCGRDRVTRRGLCWFHGNRLQRQRNPALMSPQELAAWIAGEKPRIAAHQFSLAGLPELVRLELLYALQRRDQSPPPLDPLPVRILISRLKGADSVRHVDPETACGSGGVQYNAAVRGLFADLRRYLERAWTQYAANMNTEIDAFTRVVDTMRRRLANLDPEQRAEVEESSRILRRARAARRLPLIAITAKETG
jgi:hypothetical protein